MSLLSQTIANLFNGVSQQAASLRHSSQAELQENFFPTVADGLRCRPGTKHIAKLADYSAGNKASHIINRDASERYAILADATGIRVWDVQGNERTVDAPDGLAYLTTPNPRRDLQFMTVADYTFVLNRYIQVGATGSSSSASGSPSVSITFDSAPPDGLRGWVYDFKFSATGFTTGTRQGAVIHTGTDGITNPLGETDFGEDYAYNRYKTVADMVTFLYNKLRLSGPHKPSWITVTRPSSYTLTFTADSTARTGLAIDAFCKQAVTFEDGMPGDDGYIYAYDRTSTGVNYPAEYTLTTGTASGPAALAGTKQKFADLPTTGNTVGQIYKITGDPINQSDTYYVKWDGAVWVESTEPNSAAALIPETMPHLLVRQADGTFKFRKASWVARRVGDADSSPIPSFVDRKLRGMVFFRNRLGFLSDESLVLSKAGGDYFDFFNGTATALLDSDPIDVAVSHTKVSILNHGLPFNRSLLLFSDQTQFQLTAGDVLTPKSPRLDLTTEFEAVPDCAPVVVGQSAFFVAEAGNYCQVREYFVEQDTVTNDASDVTAHVPHYVPAGVFKIAPCLTGDFLCLLTAGAPNKVFGYKFYWGAEEKVQSAWFTISLPEGEEVLGMEFIGLTGYLVVRRPSGIYFESMDFQSEARDAAAPFAVHLDRRVTLTGSYDAGTDTTTWTLPYPEEGDVSAVFGSAFGTRAGAKLTTATRPSANTVAARGNLTAGPMIIGRPFTRRYRFSRFFVRDGNNAAITSGKLKLRRMQLAFTKTGYFRVEVTPFARSTNVYHFTGRTLGELGSVVGGPQLREGTFRFPVQTDAKNAVIEIVNDSHLPCRIQSAEWDAEFILQASKQ